MPQPEIIISKGTTTTAPSADATIDIRDLGSGAIGILEHEIVVRDATIADLRAALAAADERFATLLFRANADVERAEADAAALRHKIAIALPTISAFGDSYMDAVAEHLEASISAEHPGASLPAELAAARAIVESVRPVRAWLPRLIALYAAYDAVVQARTE